MGYLGNSKLVLMEQSAMPVANFEVPADPTASSNPTQVPCSWLNTLTGQVWTCLDNTPDANVWVSNIGAFPVISQTGLIALAQNDTQQLTATTILSMFESVAGPDLLPTMTGPSAPSGDATASADNGSLYAAWKAFDKDTGTQWLAVFSNPTWIKYHFDSPVAVNQYTLTPGDSARAPVSWQFQGSNNDADWTDLDVVVSQPNFAGPLPFDVDSPDAYSYYRLYVTACNDTFVELQELGFTGSETFEVLIPGTDYSVSRVSANGEQTITVKRLKAGSTNHVIDYI